MGKTVIVYKHVRITEDGRMISSFAEPPFQKEYKIGETTKPAFHTPLFSYSKDCYYLLTLLAEENSREAILECKATLCKNTYFDPATMLSFAPNEVRKIFAEQANRYRNNVTVYCASITPTRIIRSKEEL